MMKSSYLVIAVALLALATAQKAGDKCDSELNCDSQCCIDGHCQANAHECKARNIEVLVDIMRQMHNFTAEK